MGRVNRILKKLKEYVAIYKSYQGLFIKAYKYCSLSSLNVLDEGISLIVAPHYDDETLGCGGLIALRCLYNLPTKILFLTDCGEHRRKEAIEALNTLGLSQDNIIFLFYEDGSLNESCYSEVFEKIRELNPTNVYVPHHQDTHPDHERAFKVVQLALNKDQTLWQYPIWLFWNKVVGVSKLIEAKPLIYSFSVLELKKLACDKYASQVKILPKIFLGQFLSLPVEIFYRSI